MTFFTGLEVGQQGYTSLNSLGAAVYTGFISAYFNTREIAPIIAGIALSATVGCGFTAQLGAMRVNEEIDALESIAVPSVPYLVTTRLIAGGACRRPALRAGPAGVLPVDPAHHDQALRAVVGHLRPLLQPVPAADGHHHLVRQGDGLRAHRDPDPLLLRLQSLRRTVGRRRGRRAARCALPSPRWSLVDLLLDLALYGNSVSVRIAG